MATLPSSSSSSASPPVPSKTSKDEYVVDEFLPESSQAMERRRPPASSTSSHRSRPRRRQPRPYASSSSTTQPQPQQQQQQPQQHHWRRNSPIRTNNHSNACDNSSVSVATATNNNHHNPPLPSLWAIAVEFAIVGSLYIQHCCVHLYKAMIRLRKTLLLALLGFLVALLCLTLYLCLAFYLDAARICTPPQHAQLPGRRPLVEYYVHGRGMGHFARSVAIVNRLNQHGVDVRLFLSRAAMWTALHQQDMDTSKSQQGTTTAVSVTSITPSMGFFNSLSRTIERILGDCSAAVDSHRYPLLVVSDGDVPGMLRAKLGGIPSVGIAHGQVFHIAQKPDWVYESPTLSQGWDQQGRLNFMASYFSQWQIATNFCFLESKIPTGVVAGAPMRRKILQMAHYRNHKHTDNRTTSWLPPQADAIDNLLFWNQTNQQQRPKIVVCYFRDRNGDVVLDALLRAGFMVFNFDRGFSIEKARDPKRFGVRWMVPERTRKRQRLQFLGNHNRRLIIEDERLIRVTDRSLFVPLMYIADGVASSAGSQLLSECIYVGMPLLALYSKHDSEQRLNVEMTQHACKHRPRVFGCSFESFVPSLRHVNVTPAQVALNGFVQAVRDSTISDSYYRRPRADNATDTRMAWNESTLAQSPEPFDGLPDPAEILLEIIKQVRK